MNIKDIEIWVPHETIPEQLLNLEEWKWSDNGISIILSDDVNDYIVNFKCHANSFRSTTNTFMFAFNDLYGQIREKFSLDSAWSFFKTKNSDYLEWLNHQYHGMIADNTWKVTHYLIVTEDAIIEILSDELPEVEIKERDH